MCFIAWDNARDWDRFLVEDGESNDIPLYIAVMFCTVIFVVLVGVLLTRPLSRPGMLMSGGLVFLLTGAIISSGNKQGPNKSKYHDQELIHRNR